MSPQRRVSRTIRTTSLAALTALAVSTTIVLPGLPAGASHSAWHSAWHSASHTVTDLGTLGGRDSVVDAVSADGRYVAGQSTTTDGAQHVFVWHRGRMADLGTGGFATGVDLRGRVVGVSPDPMTFAPTRGFLWQRGHLVDLPTLGGDVAVPAHITPLGLIVGNSTTAEGVPHAVTWSGSPPRIHDLGLAGPGAVDAEFGRIAGSVFTDGQVAVQPFVLRHGRLTLIPLVPGATWMTAVDLNLRGDVAGQVSDLSDATRGFLWRHGRTSVFDLGGPDAAVVGLDNHGAVFFNGTGTTEPGRPHAFVRRGATSRALLGPTGAPARVNAVNGWGLAVGEADLPPDADGTVFIRALIWRHDRPVALPGLGGSSSNATDVSETGLVFGEAQTPDGATHAVRWLPH